MFQLLKTIFKNIGSAFMFEIIFSHSYQNNLKDTLKAFDDFKNNQMLKYVCSESVFNTQYIEIKRKC